MKQSRLILAILSSLIAILLFGTGAMAVVIGDVTGDGLVGIEDSIVALQVSAGISPAINVNLSADVNGNNRIGIEEAVYVLQVVAFLRIQRLSVGPEGGVLQFSDGVILDIPAGAVTDETEIEVTHIQCEQVDAILSAQGFASHEIRCLGGFTGKPDGQEFLLPVTATLPVLPLEPGEIPVQLKVDLDEQKYHLAPTNFRYLSEAGLAEMEILGFSENVAGGLSTDEATEWTVPLDPCCTEKTIKPTCCCYWEVKSVSEYSGVFSSVGDPSGPTECSITAMKVTTTLNACPGEPQQTSWVQESTQDCPEDMTCVIDVDPPVVNLFVCQEEPLSASIDCETDGTPVSFTNSGFMPFWYSDNKFAASVDPRNGKVKGVSEGIAQVEARWGVPDPRFTPDQAVVNVRSNIRSFSVTPSQETIEIGDWVVLEAEVVGADGTLLDASEVTWSSSNEDIAYASPNTGDRPLVLGVDEGTVIITAKYEYEREENCSETILTTAQITVECSQISFTVDPGQATLAVDEERLLEAELIDEEGNTLDASDVTWSSSDPSVADVILQTGPLTSVVGKSPGGPVEITATYEYEDDCQALGTAVITVTGNLEIIKQEKPCFAKGETLQLEAIVKDEQGNELPLQGDVLWKSLNENFATVDSNGLVTALGRGIVTIEASYEEGGKLYTGKTSIQVMDLNGTWLATEVADERDCDEGINTYRQNVTISHVGSSVNALWSSGSTGGTKDDCTISGWGGESEDGGRSTSGGTLTINPNSSIISGSAIPWSWSGVDPDTGELDSCSGTSNYTLVPIP